MHPQAQAREDMILELCALSADLPASLLDILAGSSRWTKDTVSQLVKKKMIRRYRKDKIRSLRLTKKGREILLNTNRERFSTLLEGAGETRFRKTDLPTRTRMHRLAGVYLLMMEAGVAVHRDEKADIFGEQPWGSDPASVLERWSVPCFYSSVEIKAQGDDLIRIKGTRALGALFTGTPSPYLVYHTGSMPLKWSEKSEHKLSGVVKGALNNWQIDVSELHGIMVGNDMEVLLKLVTSDGGNRHHFYKVDGSYPVFHFIPLDQNGKLLLRLLCDESAKRRIAKRLARSFSPVEHHIYSCDALDGDRPVLFAWDLDMVKLRHFMDGTEQYGDRGLVLCMDFQADVMQKLFGNLAEIQPLGAYTFWKELFDGA